MQVLRPVDERSVAETLDAAERLWLEALEGNCEIFEMAAHYADLCAGEGLPASHRGVGVLPGTERRVQLGGVGTPRVAEFAAVAFGARLRMGSLGARNMLADALDVRHRLPRIWARVLARQVRVGWVRQVARATRHLSVAAASAVDAAMVEEVDGRLPWSRFLAKLDGQVVAADPETASARAAAKQQETFAKASRGSEDGMKGFFLRAPTAWVVRIDATVAYLAQALQVLGDPDEEDHRRAKAMLILANPTQAVEILAAFAHRAKHPAAGANPATRAEPVDDPLPLNDDADGEGEAADDLDDLDGGDGEDRGADPDAAHVSAAGPVPDDAAGDATEAGSAGSAGVVPVPFRPEELPAWLARAVTPEGVRLLDWPRLLPSVTLYLHLARDTLHTGPDGVLRWEGEGPITLQYLRDHLAPYQHLSVTPVLDLAGQAPVDAYEIPHRHRVAVRLRTPADTFPFAANLDPVDLDHTEAYHHAPTTTDSHRPDASDGTGAGTGTASGWRPGQSRMDNYSPLGRFHHRIKTFGRWQVRQPFDGIYIWRDPHGHYYLVDHTGTRKTTPRTQRPSTTPRPTLVIELYCTDTNLDTDDFAWAA
jgi:hypothetical protein